MKRVPLRRKTPLKKKRCTKRQNKIKKRTESLSARRRGYKVPSWFNKIPYGSHGSTPAQKRYWKVVSDTYRKEDWEKYGVCVSCGRAIENWWEGDLAHFKKYAVCNSWFKFQRENLALSCKGCNRLDDGPTGHAFGEELKRRHHHNIIEWIEKTNECFRGKKMETWEIVDKVANLRPDLVH